MDIRLVRIAVGLDLLGALGVAFGMLKLLGGNRSIWLMVIAALLNVPPAWRLCARARRHGVGSLWRWLGPPLKDRSVRQRLPTPFLLATAAAVFGLVTLGPALSYPTGWDELVYHHVLPKRWLAAGWPAFCPDLPYSGFPSLGEILFWLMAPIDGVIAPRLLTWICWALGLGLVYRLLRRRIRRASAAVLTPAFALSSTLLLISANCYVETIQLMNFSALLLALNAGQRAADRIGIGGWRKPAVLGVLAGGAAAVKLTGLAVTVVPFLWYLIQSRRDLLGQKATGGASSIHLSVAAIVVVPFYLRPWLSTGNPAYPYYASWFTNDPARLEMSRYHHALGAAFGVHGLAGFFAGPVLLAFDEQLYDCTFGWQMLIFLALAVLGISLAPRKRLRPFVMWPAAVLCLLYSCWFFTAQQARFAIPGILALMPLAAVGLRQLRGKRRQLVLAALASAVLVSTPWRTAGHYFGSALTVLGVISRADYVNESTGRDYLPLIRAIADETPRDARLLLLFEHRGFYLPRPYVIGTPFFQEAGFTPPEPFSDPARIMDLLAREQITHIVMTNKPTGPDQAATWLDRLDPLFAGLSSCVKEDKLRPIWQSDRYVLLEVQR